MANPLACSVANASLKLLLNSPWQQRALSIGQQLSIELEACRDLSAVKDIRVKGAIGVIELHKADDIHWMQPRFVDLGVWIRPFSNLVYVMPPYIIEPNDLSSITSAMAQVVSEIN